MSASHICRIEGFRSASVSLAGETLALQRQNWDALSPDYL